MLAATFSAQLLGLMDQLRGRFARQELCERAEHHLQGLLSQIDRKKSWHLAEAAGADPPHGFQYSLGRARWDANAVRDDLQHYVTEHLGDSEGVLIIDETGFLKKSDKFAGVARQYSGSAGRIENSQVVVFMAYRSDCGQALVDRELYLPQCWTADRLRCDEAGIPKATEFATKPEFARHMLHRAFDTGLGASWVTADEVYGRDSKFRELLVNKGSGYVVAIFCQQRLFLYGSYGRVDQHTQELPKQKWKKLSCGPCTKGQRFYERAFVPFGMPMDKGLRKGLLVRRCTKNPAELAYFFTHAPAGTTLAKLV